jgi:pyruvate dehydrogenase (quinone)
MPPKIEFAQMKGFVESMIKLILQGRIEDVLDTAKANMKHLKGII